ncbi:hypothetical protein [Ferroplasma sp. Type II]|uniref:hypothetical protein n=1 Tax=Ferroplasma sp. Type II TaxID=261388 RepID=UPI0025C0BA82|nr:hypothetical protein [Ferroplasma sp. Type II]
MPYPEIGDTVIILNAGAYVSSMASNYNLLPRPAEIVLEGTNEILTKDHENIGSMLAGYKTDI